MKLWLRTWDDKVNGEYQVVVRPLVLGDLGLVAGLRSQLRSLNILDERDVDYVVTNCQYEVKWSNIIMLKLSDHWKSLKV